MYIRKTVLWLCVSHCKGIAKVLRLRNFGWVSVFPKFTYYLPRAGSHHYGLCFSRRVFFLYLLALELYHSVVWSPLGRAHISASYGIFFWWPQRSTTFTIFNHDNLPITNTIVIIFSITIRFQPPKLGGYALCGPRHTAIPSPPYKAQFCWCY